MLVLVIANEDQGIRSYGFQSVSNEIKGGANTRVPSRHVLVALLGHFRLVRCLDAEAPRILLSGSPAAFIPGGGFR
jgi:hypothetical protein